MEKYVITNNLSKVYDTKAEAISAYNEIISKLEGMQRGAFMFLFHVAPYYTK